MHDGELETLEQVIEFYDQGGGNDENKSPFIHAIGLKKNEKENLVEFLKSLTSIRDKPYPISKVNKPQ